MDIRKCYLVTDEESCQLTQLTYYTVFVFLLEFWQSGEYKAQSRDHDKEARDHGNDLP